MSGGVPSPSRRASARSARVRVTFLRESGPPVVREYDVAATSRHTIGVGDAVPELMGQRFGALIESLDGVPIIVERAMYWSALGQAWKAGTNLLGTPLP